MKLISWIAVLLLRSLHATLRVRHVRAEHIENTPQYILAFWHAHLLLMMHCRFRRPMSIMISRSKDGEYIARVLHAYGAETPRGSTSRGAVGAMRELLRDARSGKNIAFTPDGPRGPARIVQAGVISGAQLTGLPVVTVAFAAKKKSCCAPGIA
ncbi:MAG TPA: DUF374 domain-containing protein [Thermoanaerobaculia bacterium]|nr:DUF374 domain-containing protein [Thermoanaerobaculia bacterium]